jgi:mannose-1-phosphate guanylyltransferase
MKAVIFAGGVGTRLWPLSRKKSPKQFEKILGDKSTLQLCVDLLRPEFDFKDIYIGTGHEYVDLVSNQLTDIPKENIIGEPMRKDLGPAVAFWMGYLSKKFPTETVIILWADHIIRDKKKFKKILACADKNLQQDPDKIIYFGHVPRFASTNLGWIHTGEAMSSYDGIEIKKFNGFKYRPKQEIADEYFTSKNHCWNLGTFATTPQFLYRMFNQFSPKIYTLTEKILSYLGQDSFPEMFKKYYAEMPEIHVDNAIAEQIDHNLANVIVEDLGWSDVGAWEALKEALEEKREENITRGKVHIENSIDNLVYNYQDNKLVVGIDLKELLVVNTEDVLLVANKNSVGKIKKLVESFQGTENEGLT